MDEKSTSSSLGDTIPNSPSVYEWHSKVQFNESTSTVNILSRSVGLVARMTALNESAKRAFHELGLLKKHNKLPYHERFVHIEPDRQTDQLTQPRTHPPEASDEGRLLKGSYILSITELPEFPALGWRIGKGRDNLPNLGVDLLLAPPNSLGTDVAGIHARFNWFPSSAGFFMIADNARGIPVLLNAESIRFDRRMILNPSMIAFGDLVYRFEFIARNKDQENKFQQYLEHFFQEFHTERPPIISPTPTGKEATIGNYILGEPIAKGAYGQVSTAKHRGTGELVAVKEILKTKGNAKTIDREIDIAVFLRSYKHDRVVYLLEDVLCVECQSYASTARIIANTDDTHRLGWNDAMQKIYLFTPLGYGTFHSLFNSRVECRRRIIFFKQALEGLSFLHSVDIMHRDIKPANLIVKSYEPPNMAIGDFGCATREKEVHYDRTGTIPYLAPEQREGMKHGKTVDVWALALVGAELFGHPRSHHDQVNFEMYRQIHHWFRTSDKDVVPIASLLELMLQWHAEKRLLPHDALSHESVASYGLPDIQPSQSRKRKQ